MIYSDADRQLDQMQDQLSRLKASNHFLVTENRLEEAEKHRETYVIPYQQKFERKIEELKAAGLTDRF